jgi:hypothetical protein
MIYFLSIKISALHITFLFLHYIHSCSSHMILMPIGGVDDIGLNVMRHRLMLPDPYQLTVEVHLAVPSFLLEIVCSNAQSEEGIDVGSDGVFR